MNNNDIKIIIQELEKLKGEYLHRITRAGSMVMFQLGEFIEKDFHSYAKGEIISTETKLVPKYALHIDCCFRLSCAGEMIIAKCDLYQPHSKLENKPDFDFEQFDWDVQGSNRFDELIYKYFSEGKPVNFKVKKIEAYKLGDLKIYFENGFLLEAIIDISGNEECWRFFEVGNKDNHLVVNGRGIEKYEDKSL